MRRPIVSLIVIAIVLATTASATPGAAGGPETVRRGPLPPLLSARQFTLVGVPTASGCLYPARDFVMPQGVTDWEIREVAVDRLRCVTFLEEGIPTRIVQPLGNSVITLAADGLGTRSSGKLRRPLATHYASGYQYIWFESGQGTFFTAEKSSITWTFNYTCATGGNGSGQWTWDNTKFDITAYNISASLICSYYEVNTTATYQGKFFYWACRHDYWENRARGRYDGLIQTQQPAYSAYSNCYDHWLRILIHQDVIG